MANNKKRFELNSKNDYILYLYNIILRIEWQKNAMKKTLDELEQFIKENEKTEVSNINIKIDYRVYERYSRMLDGCQNYLLNLFGDHQADSISYIKFRDIIKKRKTKNTLGFNIRDLDEKTENNLEKLKRFRNWANHVPESLLIADIELGGGDLSDISFNPIQVRQYLFCSLDYIIGLFQNSSEIYKLFIDTYQSIKRDYEDLLGAPILFNNSYEDIVIQRNNLGRMVASNSAKIQKLK